MASSESLLMLYLSNQSIGSAVVAFVKGGQCEKLTHSHKMTPFDAPGKQAF